MKPAFVTPPAARTGLLLLLLAAAAPLWADEVAATGSTPAPVDTVAKKPADTLANVIPGAVPLKPASRDTRFFVPTEGYRRARDLPDSLKGKISSLEFTINDAFEGSETHSAAERYVYDLGNKLHVNTREATVRRRLSFREDDTVTVDKLREAEKHLRDEQFLADAIIEVRRLPDSTLAVKVTTYDQWTTVPAVSLSRKGGEWVWWVGPVESNLLGTGQRVGFFVGHDLERDSRWIDYSNTAFTDHHLQVLADYGWLSDGYSYAFSLSKPLLARTDRWAFTLSASGDEFAETEYLSGNDLDRLQRDGNLPPGREYMLGQTNPLAQWTRVATHNGYAGVTRSFGYSLKTSVTPFYERLDRYNIGDLRVDTAMYNRLRPDLTLNERHDEILGASLSLYKYAYKTVSNFRNLKWSENIETGWRLTGSLGRNQEWLGARNPDWLLSGAGVYNDAWDNTLFLNSNASVRTFVSDAGKPDDGTVSGYAEGQWKPVPLLATVVSGQWDNLFAATGSQQLTLGEESGLLGYPNFYYTGKARFLCSAEQRFFPPVEFGTVVPALAVFANAGNAYDSYGAVNLADLHYAAGVGLRLGATRSVQKVVNHINLTWPLGEKNLSAVVFGVQASKSL